MRLLLAVAFFSATTSAIAVARAQSGNANYPNGRPNAPAPPPPVTGPPEISRFVHADSAGKDDAFVQRLGYVASVTYHPSLVSVGFAGVAYSLRVRGPYDRRGVFGHPDDPSEGHGAFPAGAVLGNEVGIELRLFSSYRTAPSDAVTTTFAFAPVSIVRRGDWRVTFPSIVGALLPEFGFVFVHTKERGDTTRDEVYVRHQARFQILLGEKQIDALDVVPFVQLSVPSDDDRARRYVRFEGGVTLGISTDL